MVYYTVMFVSTELGIICHWFHAMLYNVGYMPQEGERIDLILSPLSQASTWCALSIIMIVAMPVHTLFAVGIMLSVLDDNSG